MIDHMHGVRGGMSMLEMGQFVAWPIAYNKHRKYATKSWLQYTSALFMYFYFYFTHIAIYVYARSIL